MVSLTRAGSRVRRKRRYCARESADDSCIDVVCALLRRQDKLQGVLAITATGVRQEPVSPRNLPASRPWRAVELQRGYLESSLWRSLCQVSPSEEH